MALRSAVISSRGGVHEVHVLGQRLAQRLGHGLHAPVGHQAPADLGLDLLLELLDARLVLVALEALLQRGEGLGRVVAGLVHEPLEHVVEVQVPQRPVEVVGAAHGAAGLHAGVALDRLAGERPQHGLVALEQRPVEHLGQLLGAHLVAAGAPHALEPLEALEPLQALHALELAVALGPVAVGVVAQGVLLAAQREVDLEDGLEGAPVGVGLHQGGAEGVLERLPVLEGDVLDRLHGIEVLGQAHRQARLAELDDEAAQQLEQRRAGGGGGGIGHGRPPGQLVAGGGVPGPGLGRAGLVAEHAPGQEGPVPGLDRRHGSAPIGLSAPPACGSVPAAGP